MGNDKKSEQLGMPYGAASGKLRKNILFALLAKNGENICYQCGGVIYTVDELSIEHKIPWLDNKPELFWDLDNVAFSHLSCNSSAARKDWTKSDNNRQRVSDRFTIPVTTGNKRCCYCKLELPKAAFTANRNKKDGLQDECRSCRSQSRRKT